MWEIKLNFSKVTTKSRRVGKVVVNCGKAEMDKQRHAPVLSTDARPGNALQSPKQDVNTTLPVRQRWLGVVSDYVWQPCTREKLKSLPHMRQGCKWENSWSFWGSHLDEHVFCSRGMGFCWAVGKPIIILRDFRPSTGFSHVGFSTHILTNVPRSVPCKMTAASTSFNIILYSSYSIHKWGLCTSRPAIHAGFVPSVKLLQWFFQRQALMKSLWNKCNFQAY